MDGRTTAVSDTVRSFGQEGLRIVSLIVGFAVVQLVLMVAAFRSRRQNINSLIAFILLFVGVVCVVAVGVGAFASSMSLSNRAVARLGFVAALAILLLGMFFKQRVIAIPTGTIVVSGNEQIDAACASSKSRLQEVARLVQTGKAFSQESMATALNRWSLTPHATHFVGFDSDEEFMTALPHLGRARDSLFLCLGSSANGVLHTSNSFRLMPTNGQQWKGARCSFGTSSPVTLIVSPQLAKWKGDFADAAAVLTWDSQNTGPVKAALQAQTPLNIFMHVTPEDLASIAKAVEASTVKARIRLSQTAAYTAPAKETWAWLRSTAASVGAMHSSALEPYSCTRSVLMREALELCREIVMGSLEDFRSHFEINKFVTSSVPGMRFDEGGDRSSPSGGMGQSLPHPTKDEWVVSPIMPASCATN